MFLNGEDIFFLKNSLDFTKSFRSMDRTVFKTDPI